MQISHEWIYRYIWKNKTEGGHIYQCLRRAGKQYNKRANKDAGLGFTRSRADIERRPAAVETRNRMGDWEGDLVLEKKLSCCGDSG
jgi:transposase, IS30 family